jgi:hypothetical protein
MSEFGGNDQQPYRSILQFTGLVAINYHLGQLVVGLRYLSVCRHGEIMGCFGKVLLDPLDALVQES